MKPQHQTAQYFDAVSAQWQGVYFETPRNFSAYRLQKRHTYALDWVAKHLKAGERVLDVGCGAGVTALTLAEMGYQVSGLDLAPQMIALAQEAAQQQNLGVDFRIGSAESLPYPDGHFKAVIALGLFGNLPDEASALSELWRVLAPDGWLLATMPNSLALDRWLSLPRALPIILGGRARRPLRHMGNIFRRLRGQSPKPLSDLRFGKSCSAKAFQNQLSAAHYQNIDYAALSFGPFYPLGLGLLSQTQTIRLSEALCRVKALHWGGTTLIYSAQKPQTPDLRHNKA